MHWWHCFIHQCCPMSFITHFTVNLKLEFKVYFLSGCSWPYCGQCMGPTGLIRSESTGFRILKCSSCCWNTHMLQYIELVAVQRSRWRHVGKLIYNRSTTFILYSLFYGKGFQHQIQAEQYKSRAGAKWQKHSNRGEGKIIETLANAKSLLPPF